MHLIMSENRSHYHALNRFFELAVMKSKRSFLSAEKTTDKQVPLPSRLTVLKFLPHRS